jgi:hypothetical protein
MLSVVVVVVVVVRGERGRLYHYRAEADTLRRFRPPQSEVPEAPGAV